AVSRAEIKMIARNVATQVAQDTVLNSNEVKAIASEAAAGKAQEVIESAGLSGDQIDATMKQAIMAFIKSAATESGQAGRDTARPPEQDVDVAAIDPASEPVAGNPDARYQFIVYSDFECPY